MAVLEFKRKFLARLSLMVITLPLLYLLIFLLPYQGFLALNIAIIVVGLFSSREVQRLLEQNGHATFPWFAPALGASIPLATYLQVSGLIGQDSFLLWLCVLIMVLLVRSLWIQREKDLPRLLERVTSSLFVMLYPCFFLAFIVRMTGLANPSHILLFFLCLIFTNDIIAYLVGRFIARGLLRLIISPHKTLAGFIAGFAGAVIMSLVFYYAFPWLFDAALPSLVGIGAAMGVATIAGDLVESALKRSAKVKDTGSVMIGRGGFMDSIDSMLLCAPLYYYLIQQVTQRI